MASTFINTYCTTTMLGMINRLHGVTDLSYVAHHNTTLNHKYGQTNPIPAGVGLTPTVASLPSLQYFGIGIRGTHNVLSDTFNVSQPYCPKSTNMDMYTPIPFRVRLLADDLTPTERLDYRMREVRVIDGEQHVLYWLKKIEYPTTNQIDVTVVDGDGNESDFDFNNIAEYMTPTPDPLYVPSVDPANPEGLHVSMSGVISVTGDEVREAINMLYDGNTLLSSITELGLYTGVETPLSSGTGMPVTETYTEAMYVQLAAHRCWAGTSLADVSAGHIENITFRNGNIISTPSTI